MIRRETRPYSATVSCACSTRSSTGSSSVLPRMTRSTDTNGYVRRSSSRRWPIEFLRLHQVGAARDRQRPAEELVRRAGQRRLADAVHLGLERARRLGGVRAQHVGDLHQQDEQHHADAVRKRERRRQVGDRGGLVASGGRRPARPAPRPGPGWRCWRRRRCRHPGRRACRTSPGCRTSTPATAPG